MTKAICTNCGQTLQNPPDTNNVKLLVENCKRCGYSNWVADIRPQDQRRDIYS